MADFLIMIVSVSIVLGVMVLVHEWGHFVVAKSLGVRVEIFSIGFGTRLWGVKRGDTDYRLSALPLGGYVKMAGDNPLEERKGDPDEFLSKPRWQRVLIALAGPAMNIIMSFLLFTGIYMTGTKQPAFLDRAMVVAGVLPDSTAQKAGIVSGDHIVSVNGVSNPTWDRARMELSTALPGHSLAVTVDRNGHSMNLSLPPGPYLEDVYGYPQDQVFVDAVTPGMPAERSGLQHGDQILSVNSEPIENAAAFPPIVQQSQGKPLDIVLRRDGREMHIEVSAERVSSTGGASRWQIGVLPSGEMVSRRLSVFGASRESFALNALLGRQVLSVVVELFRGNISLKQLEGPLGIARESGRAAKEGATQLLSLMALIGINLAVLNLLPIPPLDGGHILLLVIEGTIRHDLSMRVKERFVTVSMVFLLLIFAIVMYNDVLRLIPTHH